MIRKKMEVLMKGQSIDQNVEENLTYDYLHSSEENFWSILYLTGYLTREKKEKTDGTLALKIPNKEIQEIFETTISYHDYREDFYHAFLGGIFAGAGYSVESNKEHGEGRSDL